MSFASSFKKKQVADYWENPKTFATSLVALAIDSFSTECFSWEPETIRLQVSDLYNAQPPQANFDKLFAMLTILTTDKFYTNVDIFTNIANALNNKRTDFQLWSPISVEDATWAMTEAYINDPLPSKVKLDEVYSNDIRRYLGVLLEQEHIITPPDILEIAIMKPSFKSAELSFADDPALFLGYQNLSQQKTAAITKYVKARLQDLFKELNELPLQTRDSQRWEEFLSRAQKSR